MYFGDKIHHRINREQLRMILMVLVLFSSLHLRKSSLHPCSFVSISLLFFVAHLEFSATVGINDGTPFGTVALVFTVTVFSLLAAGLRR